MDRSAQSEIVARIQSALEAARVVLNGFTPGAIAAEYKAGNDPVTAADHAVDAILHRLLLRADEGWLSEETVDDLTRLDKRRVWIVDPLDGTREFVSGIPEFCISVAMVEDGIPVAGGICNPATDELIIGSLATGITYNGKTARVSDRKSLAGASVLASRSEMKRGEWDRFHLANFEVKQMGSVAYKLGLVAAGFADVTFTLTPKNEWDVAAGAALVQSAGGFVATLDHAPLRCNQRDPLLSGLIAGAGLLKEELLNLLSAKPQSVQ